MKYNISKSKILAGLIALTVVVAVMGAYFYDYQRKNVTAMQRISSLESQVAALGTALQDSNATNAANKEQLDKMAKKGSATASSPAPAALPQENLVTSAVAKASPAVVSIAISQEMPVMEMDYINPLGNDPAFQDIQFRVPVFKQNGTKMQEVSSGSGFIVNPNGYILTNKHVVSESQAEYWVTLSSGEKKQAKLVYRDNNSDVAVLKIEGNGYPTLVLGDSSALRLGQTVAAIGNALGQYNNSVSVGIVSGLNRTIEALDDTGEVEKLSGIVQTDAAINRGNSGGPLIDLSGKVVGINVAMEQGANNIAFAIPVNEIKMNIDKIVPQ